MKDTFEYDLAIHLAGEQAIPNLLGVRHIKAKRHVLFVSERSKMTYDQIKKCIPSSTIFDSIELGAFNIDEILNSMKEECQKAKSVAINLTGGTKIMALGAWLSTFDIAAFPIKFFYFNTEFDELLSWTMDTPVQKEPIDKLLSLKDFFNLSYFPKTRENVDEKLIISREMVTKSAWKNNNVFSKVQSAAQKALPQGRSSLYYDFTAGTPETIYASLQDKNKTLIVQDQEIDVSQWDDFCEYLAGRWFEEYVWLLLKPLRDKGAIKKMKTGISVSSTERPNNTIQEFDLLITDGLRLIVIECKSGMVDQNMFNKLEENVKKFAGAQGKGILLLRWPLNKKNPQHENIIQRISDTKSQCSCIHGGQIATELTKRIFTINPRTIFPPVK